MNWLLLHGTPLTPAVWDGVLPLLEGEIACPHIVPGDGPASARQAAIADAISDSVAIEPPWHVVGHSFGGQVALELAIRWPKLVSKLTLLCTRDSPYPSFAAMAETVERTPVDVDMSMKRWFSPAELTAAGPAVAYARGALRAADTNEWAGALSAIAVFDATASTSTIRCPAQVVAAEHDSVSDPETMAAMHGRLRDSVFVELAGAWHMSVFTDSERLARVLNR